jgi:hypothetical protein
MPPRAKVSCPNSTSVANIMVPNCMPNTLKKIFTNELLFSDKFLMEIYLSNKNPPIKQSITFGQEYQA